MERLCMVVIDLFRNGPLNAKKIPRTTLEIYLFEQTFKNIDDVLWKDPGCDSELDYIGQTSWIMFLRYLDELEIDKADEADLKGEAYS